MSYAILIAAGLLLSANDTLRHAEANRVEWWWEGTRRTAWLDAKCVFHVAKDATPTQRQWAEEGLRICLEKKDWLCDCAKERQADEVS